MWGGGGDDGTMIQSFDFQDDPDSDDDPEENDNNKEEGIDDPRKEDDDEQGDIDEPKAHGVYSGSAGDIDDGRFTDRDDGDHEEDSPLSSLSSSSQATTPQRRPDAEQRKPDVARGKRKSHYTARHPNLS